MRFWVFLLLFICANALASLGDSEATVEKDRQMMHATRKMTPHETYRVHEIVEPEHKVREYVTPDGVVFAVTWRGMGQPDLQQLFGAFYQEYQEADIASHRPVGRAPKKVKSTNMITEKFGHMRDVRGRAYIPNLVPAGVDLKDIK